jgi:sarcosine oxidase, subunit alpha
VNRLTLPDTGLLIDRSKEIRFLFDGRTQYAHPGDVIASALIANGRMLQSRSFKYHRPRGPLTMAGHDVNALVQVGDDPNVRGDRHEVRDGLDAISINRYGSLDNDIAASLGLFARFLPVGFYYKTFFRPNGSWKFFERPIRELAGLGTLDPAAPHGAFDKAYEFCDVLVIGGGPAGLQAALAAGQAGAETLLVDEWPRLGGSLLYGRIDGSRDKANEARGIIEAVIGNGNVSCLQDATATGIFQDGWVSVIRKNRLHKVRAKQIVLATGGFDQPLVFPNNDRPGIMFADAAQRLIRLYGVKPGERAVIATANHFGYEAALDLKEAGIDIAAIVDLTSGAPETDALAARHGLPVIRNAALTGSNGKKRVSSVAIAPLDGEGAPNGKGEIIPCDLVLMSVGYTPALNLASHAGAKVRYDAAINMHRASGGPDWLRLAGAANGVWSYEAVVEDGEAAGRAAAAAALGKPAPKANPIADPLAARVTHPYPIVKGGKGFVDFDEDLSVKDIENSIADGYEDIQLIKRYSTVGIGPSQGRHSNLNTIRIAARKRGKDIEAIGTTTFRPPLMPETFGHMAGRGFDPVRLTPMHQRHLALGAEMMAAGAWKRPAHYGGPDGGAQSIAAEVAAVRGNVGLIDVSTLGKLEIRGPDAAAFIERMYSWTYAKQPIGKCKYLLMTDQAGIITDDGVAARLHDMHFYCTATTSGVDQVYRQMTWWNTQWKMDVDVTNVTAAYAAVNIAGPKARAVLSALSTDIDLSAAAFPYLGVRMGRLAGIPVRMMRVGFVGELGFEIHCPSRSGEFLWDRLMEAGKPHGIMPFGVEAQRVLRLEKGHIIVGQDTDGLTHPGEAAMEWALGMKKPFFIGQRSLKILQAKPQTRRLAGFVLLDAEAPMPKENHLIIDGNTIAGRITSVARSAALGKVVGLAFVPPEKAEPGSRFDIRVDGGRMVNAEVVALPFYDPEGRRQEL